MSFIIVPYTKAEEEGVKRFNQRLASKGFRFRFPEVWEPSWLPKISQRKLFQDFFLLKEEGEIRGAYILKRQEFFIRDQVRSIGYYHFPISEGIIDKRYNGVGLFLIKDALKREPCLFSLGIGGLEEPLAQLLKILGWRLFSVPFFFKVFRIRNFFKKMQYFNQSLSLKILSGLLLFSGLGFLLIKGYQGAVGIKGRLLSSRIKAVIVPKFEEWTNEIWVKSKREYKFVAKRDQEVLNILYPSSNKRFIKIKILEKEQIIGWAVVMNTQMNDNRYFGSMQIGSIVDFMALSRQETKIIGASLNILRNKGVDMVVMNQSSSCWKRAIRSCGFINGPSNFIFACSPQLSRELDLESNMHDVFLCRGDGDGPINL